MINGNGLPVMVYDYLDPRLRLITDNIFHAQKAGWPSVLTYVYRNSSAKRQIRRDSLRLVPGIESRDEYPFASTLENGGNVWVGHAPAAQQDAQRDLINAFYRQNGAYLKGSTLRFEVRVINHPQQTA